MCSREEIIFLARMLQGFIEEKFGSTSFGLNLTLLIEILSS